MQSIIKAWQHLETDPLLYICPAITIDMARRMCFKQTNTVNKFGQTLNISNTSQATTL